MFYLIEEKEELARLKTEYKNDPNVLTKIDNLHKDFSYMRRVAGDGNCFYRAFAFAYFEYLLCHQQEWNNFKSHVQEIKGELIALGYDSHKCTAWHDKVNLNEFL